MSENKQCVSVRLKPSDLEMIERIAERLGAKNSEVIRYAIKTALTRLMPLHDPHTDGHRLLPLFIANSHELNRHFDLDADRLNTILNGKAGHKTEMIDRMDIELLALCDLSPQYIQTRLLEITGKEANPEDIPQVLHKYLLEKYKNRLPPEDPEVSQSLQ